MFIAYSVDLVHIFTNIYDEGHYLMHQNPMTKSRTSATGGDWLAADRPVSLGRAYFSDLNQTTTP
jgi:hypothetical protein